MAYSDEVIAAAKSLYLKDTHQRNTKEARTEQPANCLLLGDKV